MRDYITVLAMADELGGELGGIEKDAFLGKAILGVTKRVAQPMAGAAGRAAEATGSKLMTGAQGKLRAAPEVVKKWLGTEAGKASMQRWGGRLATSGAMGVGGGAVGAATAGPDATVKDRLRRAAGGAMLGAGAGLLAGQAVTQAGRAQARRVAARQRHSITGYMPRTKEQIARGVSKGGKGMSEAERVAALEGMGIRGGGMDLAAAEAAGFKGVQKYLRGGQGEAVRRGMTSIPGFARELVKHPGQAAAIGLGSGGVMGGALMGGFGLMQLPHAMKRTQQSGRAENLGQLIGETAGYTLGAPVPIVGNLALGSLGGQIGKAIGKGVGKITRAGQPLPAGQAGPQGHYTGRSLTTGDIQELRRRSAAGESMMAPAQR